MTEKIRIGAYVDKKAWEELGKYIECSKSEWINLQIINRINQTDSISELEQKIKEIENKQNELDLDKRILKEEIETIRKRREENDRNKKIIDDKCTLIKNISDKQEYIERERIYHIAKTDNEISPDILFKYIEDNNITIRDISIGANPIMKEIE